MATTNGSTAIRDKILASLARYRALRIGKFPCAFWRLSARPGLIAMAGMINKMSIRCFYGVFVKFRECFKIINALR
ncbi:hypothetical protein [Bathymodiolus japonicus methanotrophic gill symbiont]|uniref:hypothetical protein n=1 Tax=Bathymodiolus japonicus methanotrophic gill symbiont TaxID=113269 RepID=UPI001C8DFFEE|nr:hypothetical protein [Bathymodiolus japonicus methanotrophic gill symbiont]